MEVRIMHYALLGDIHSSKEDLEKVLADISEKAPTAKLIGTRDTVMNFNSILQLSLILMLFEC